MNPIDSLFHHLRAAGRKAFIPFITAGDPDTATTAAAARTLAAAGADLIEIGFPYSDPIADGPVIQASYTRALAGGIRLDGVFRCIHELRGLPVPLAGMVSFSLVHRRGPETFVRQAKESGLSGLIVPDLPLEESESLGQIAAAADVKLKTRKRGQTPISYKYDSKWDLPLFSLFLSFSCLFLSSYLSLRVAMQTEEITIRVDTEAARAYRAASEQERRKLDLLLSLRLHDALHPSGSLQDMMRDLSRKAQDRGLTPEILESILHDR